jgi:hypothetical protein
MQLGFHGCRMTRLLTHKRSGPGLVDLKIRYDGLMAESVVNRPDGPALFQKLGHCQRATLLRKYSQPEATTMAKSQRSKQGAPDTPTLRQKAEARWQAISKGSTNAFDDFSVDDTCSAGHCQFKSLRNLPNSLAGIEWLTRAPT